jgi:tetratricopeptide (TPR) repeat protein
MTVNAYSGAVARRSEKMMRAYFLASFVILTLAATAHAQSIENICLESWDRDPVIQACSVMVEDRSRPPRELAQAFNKRALAWGGKARSGSISYENKHDYEARQMADYDKAIELDPIWLYFHNRAEAKRQMRENTSALPDAERAVELVKKDRSVVPFGRANAYETRGAIYLALGQKDKAAADFLTAYRINPDSEDARDGLRAVGVEPNRAIEWIKSFFLAD